MDYLRGHAPDVGVEILGIKPRVGRLGHYPAMERTNALISDYAGQNENAVFLDSVELLLDTAGTPAPVCCLDDKLDHGGEEYRRWTQALYPILKSWHETSRIPE